VLRGGGRDARHYCVRVLQLVVAAAAALESGSERGRGMLSGIHT